jgi:hypothetical protein
MEREHPIPEVGLIELGQASVMTHGAPGMFMEVTGPNDFATGLDD